MKFFSIKNFFNRSQKNKTLEEDLYSLDSYQLNNLIEKNISFDFFQLESLNGKYKDNKILQKAKGKEELLSELKTKDLNKPIVLICKTGEHSKAFSKELRDKGFINVYFVKKGLQSIS